MATHDPHVVVRWRTLIADWQRSGLSVTAFCRARNVNKSGFYRWQNILNELDHPSTTITQLPDLVPHSPSFVPVRVIPDALVEVILPSGLQLRVPLSADAQQLARLVLALGATPC